ncbi:MAG: peroxiredoxin [Candidatus Binatia bacterium]|nr:peroxiredoxin [Candidatus Binatia bacterium]
MKRNRTISAIAACLALLAAGIADAAMLEKGDPMPDWNLPDHTGAKLASKDLAGKSYLLWFYPKAQTPGCTIEGQNFRDQHAAFAAAGVEVLGISFDTPDGNAAFVKAESFPFRLLSDDGSLAYAVGAAEPGGAKYARRISYLVGPDGRVREAYGTVVPANHAAQVLGDLANEGG